MIRVGRVKIGVWFGAGVCFAGVASAQDTVPAPVRPLPEPLSLQQALELADKHPEVDAVSAQIQRARAEYAMVRAQSGWQLDLVARAAALEPSPLQFEDDREEFGSGVVLQKRLFDFGQRSALAAVKSAEQERFQLDLIDTKAKHQLRVMELFFAILDADLRYVRENEAMSVAFVRFERTRDNREVGKVSDVDVLEKEDTFQKTRLLRFEARAAQRSAREHFAAALSVNTLPGQLLAPKLTFKKTPEDFSAMVQTALQNNPHLLALRAQVKAAQTAVSAARRQSYPVIQAGVEAWNYSRELSGRDRWRAGVEVRIPILQGGAVNAMVSKAQADLLFWQSQLESAELQVRERLAQEWTRLDVVRVEREGAARQLDYRDLNLDRFRALYELEVRADLGDAMTQTSEARWRAAQADFNSIMTWARIQALMGETISLTAMQE